MPSKQTHLSNQKNNSESTQVEQFSNFQHREESISTISTLPAKRPASPPMVSRQNALALQRLIGNRAVTRLIRNGKREVQRHDGHGGVKDHVHDASETPDLPDTSLTAESLANFTRGVLNSQFCGIASVVDGKIHLAYSKGSEDLYTVAQQSLINSAKVELIPTRMGHAKLAAHAGVAAKQIRPGLAVGQAVGFAIKKTGESSYEVLSWNSGLNVERTKVDGENTLPSKDQTKVTAGLSAITSSKPEKVGE